MRALQRRLRGLGAPVADPQGCFGPDTEAAVRAFQRRRPWWLEDGIVTAEVLADLDAALQRREGERQLAALAAGRRRLTGEQLQRRPALVTELQRRLRGLGLPAGGPTRDGQAGPGLHQALARFRRLAGVDPVDDDGLDPATAAALRTCRWLPALTARWRPAAARRRFAAEARRLGASDARLAFLDRGAGHSPWLESLADPVLPGAEARPSGRPAGLRYRTYPKCGVRPAIEAGGLDCLGPEIGQACVCIGRRGPRGLEAAWLGRDPLDPVECLSATKLVPLLNVLARLGPGAADGDAVLAPWGSAAQTLALERVLVDVVSYAGSVGSSNALAATLNQLEPRREGWIRGCTGGPAALRFGGRYGEPPSLARPDLRHSGSGAVLLPFGAAARAGNALSVYDLTRLLSLLGWRELLAPAQRLAGLEEAGARLACRALACDPARYLDVAFASLGLERRVDTPLILSKMGYGESALVYSAFLHVRDHREPLPVEHSLALTLRCPKGTGDREAVRADLAMAEAVASLLAWVLEPRR